MIINPTQYKTAQYSMQKIWTLLLFALCLSASATAWSQDTSDDETEPATEPVVRITKIKFKGVKSIPKEEIKNKIATEFPSIRFWVKKPEFEEEILQNDMIRIRRLYANNGFYNSTAQYKLKHNEEQNTVAIKIYVDEGKPVLLKQLDLFYTHDLDESILKKIKKAIPLRLNKRFSLLLYQETKGIITSILSNIGYPRANVQGEALVNRNEGWAKASFTIEHRGLYRFGTTQVSGNKKVTSRVILREVVYKQGKLYSARDLETSQSRIFELSLFSSVLIDTSYDEENKLVNIQINVIERKYSSIKVGVGFGTEDLFRGQILWVHRNFLGGGRRIEIAGKFSFLTQRVESEFVQPYAVGSGSEMYLQFSSKRDDLPSFTAESLLGTTGLKKEFNTVYETFLDYNFQYSRLVEITDATQIFVEDDRVRLSFFTMGIERDTTRNPLDPKRGTVAQLFFESSITGIGSEENYLKGTLRLKGYKKLGGTVFASRLAIGVIQPFGSTGRLGVPIFARFFSGGGTSVRGFGFLRLGPLDSNNEPVGGNSLIEGSVEGRFPLWKEFSMVVFFDFGNVFAKQWDFQLDDLKYSPGIGLRYKTLIGPIRADLGYAITSQPGSDRVQFFFSIGHAF